MKKLLVIFIAVCEIGFCSVVDLGKFDQRIVLKTKHIEVPGKPCGFNPTMVRLEDKYLMAFRHQPLMIRPWLSDICVVLLDENFDVCSKAVKLDTRELHPDIPSRSEDPRLIWCGDHLFLLYNDNLDEGKGHPSVRREMYIVEVFSEEGRFWLGKPVLLKHPRNYPKREQEKNWIPFAYEDQLLIAYMVNPHEIMIPDLETGECQPYLSTEFEAKGRKDFTWGFLSGGTPGIDIGDYYLGFFHSFEKMQSNVSVKEKKFHYFGGAYTFSKEPPFEVLSISPHPIVGKDFYTSSDAEKRVVFPGSFVVEGDRVFMAYGKDDCSMYIATLSLPKLLNSLVKVPFEHYSRVKEPQKKVKRKVGGLGVPNRR